VDGRASTNVKRVRMFSTVLGTVTWGSLFDMDFLFKIGLNDGCNLYSEIRCAADILFMPLASEAMLDTRNLILAVG
jgi:hypothetical protein